MLSRVFKTKFDAAQGQVIHSYLHNKVLPGVGRIGSIFLLESGDASLNGEVGQIAQSLAMHAAAMKPSYTTAD